MDQVEFNNKKKEVLSKFKEDFVKEYYRYDPMFHAVAQMLIMDADPYEIIQQLIEDRVKLEEQIKELILNKTNF